MRAEHLPLNFVQMESSNGSIILISTEFVPITSDDDNRKKNVINFSKNSKKEEIQYSFWLLTDCWA